MRRRALTAVVALGAAVVAVVIVGLGGRKDNAYLVRGIFANAASVVIDADIRVAGATVGHVKSLGVTPQHRAAVVMAITDPAFQRFYRDAQCAVRLQSLIGEKFINCSPGTPGEPELPLDPANKGVRLMTISHTTSAIDPDTSLNTLNLPTRERLRIIFDELGIALAGRGPALNDAIRRLNPAFREFNKVQAILARENRVLANLARDGDRALIPLARERKHIIGTLAQSDKVARATLEERAAFKETWARLPAFLAQLEPTARELRKFAVDAQPAAHAARLSGKDFSTFITHTPQLAAAANKGFTRFSDATEVLRGELPSLLTIAQPLRGFAANGRPAVRDLNAIFASFVKQGGVENLLSLTFGIAGAMNGFDSFGHFMRSALVADVGTCLFYNNQRDNQCAADFVPGRAFKDPTPATGSAAALNYLLGGRR